MGRLTWTLADVGTDLDFSGRGEASDVQHRELLVHVEDGLAAGEDGRDLVHLPPALGVLRDDLHRDPTALPAEQGSSGQVRSQVRSASEMTCTVI